MDIFNKLFKIPKASQAVLKQVEEKIHAIKNVNYPLGLVFYDKDREHIIAESLDDLWLRDTQEQQIISSHSKHNLMISDYKDRDLDSLKIYRRLCEVCLIDHRAKKLANSLNNRDLDLFFELLQTNLYSIHKNDHQMIFRISGKD